MTADVAKNLSFLSKFLGWLKNNWVVVLVVLGVLLLGWWSWTTINGMRKKEQELTKIIEQQHTQHLQELADLEGSFQRQAAAQQNIEKEFSQRLQALDQKYTDQLGAIRNTQVNRERHLIANPSELPDAIRQAFNIPSGDQPQ